MYVASAIAFGLQHSYSFSSANAFSSFMLNTKNECTPTEADRCGGEDRAAEVQQVTGKCIVPSSGAYNYLMKVPMTKIV